MVTKAARMVVNREENVTESAQRGKSVWQAGIVPPTSLFRRMKKYKKEEKKRKKYWSFSHFLDYSFLFFFFYLRPPIYIYSVAMSKTSSIP